MPERREAGRAPASSPRLSVPFAQSSETAQSEPPWHRPPAAWQQASGRQLHGLAVDRDTPTPGIDDPRANDNPRARRWARRGAPGVCRQLRQQRPWPNRFRQVSDRTCLQPQDFIDLFKSPVSMMTTPA